MAGENFVVWRGGKTGIAGLDSSGSKRALDEKSEVSNLPGSESSRVGQALPPDPEVVEKPVRRRFSAEYKLRIIREADACGPGELGALLRREGLYFSNLSCWRRQLEEGELAALAPKQRGRKKQPVNPLATRALQLERENQRLRRRLRQAEQIIEVQKKISEVLGISLKDGDEGETN